MICINKEGEVKVWPNKNLSKHFPDSVSIGSNKTEE
jgi:hypothetical protein